MDYRFWHVFKKTFNWLINEQIGLLYKHNHTALNLMLFQWGGVGDKDLRSPLRKRKGKKEKEGKGRQK